MLRQPRKDYAEEAGIYFSIFILKYVFHKKIFKRTRTIKIISQKLGFIKNGLFCISLFYKKVSDAVTFTVFEFFVTGGFFFH